MASEKRKRTPLKTVEIAAGRAGLRFGLWLAGNVSRKTVLRAGSALGLAAWRLAKSRRALAERNLARAFPDWSPDRVRETAREVFRHQGMNLLEFFHMPAMDGDAILRAVRFEGVDEQAFPAFARGKGALAITAHIGNFEFFGASIVRKGIPLTVIARETDDAEMNEGINGIRGRMGYRVIARHQAAREAFATLKRNEVLAVLPDQNDGSGVWAPFFGETAGTTIGPAVLALRTGAAVVPAFIYREGDDHVVSVRAPISYEPTGDRDADVLALTTLINKAVEDVVREHPEQWFWFHDRWRSRPPGESAAAPSAAEGSAG